MCYNIYKMLMSDRINCGSGMPNTIVTDRRLMGVTAARLQKAFMFSVLYSYKYNACFCLSQGVAYIGVRRICV